jgi:DNA-binding XRE family transcriptional regulator
MEAVVLSVYVDNFGEMVPVGELKKSIRCDNWSIPAARAATNICWRMRDKLQSVGLTFTSDDSRNGRALIHVGGAAALMTPATFTAVDMPSGEWIRNWRRRLGWTRTQASRALGISAQWLMALENETLKRDGKPAAPTQALSMAMLFIQEKAE